MTPERIRQLLPHREPFLFIDEVVECDPGQRVVCLHHVRDDAFWVPGHFPGNPVMPGVLIGEALAQAAAIAYLSQFEPSDDPPEVYLVGMDKLRFRRMVRPGETLQLAVEVERIRRSIGTFTATATVAGERAANGTLLATMNVG